MRSFSILLLALGSLLFAASPPAHAEKRIALLIGNQGYADAVGPLKNPHNDIAVVGRALEEVGFTLLKPLKDGSRDDILFQVHDLAARLRKAGPGAIGFLYYTGHGVAVAGDNVLIPTNARATTDAELNVRGVKLADVVDILKGNAPDAVHFLVLDACRNNIRGQKGAKGFAPINDQRTGVVLAFATAAGETASDEGAAGGPYALALAEEIVKPGRNDQAVFNAVRTRVVAATRGQTPWTHDGLIGERVVFKAAATSVPQASAVTLPQLNEAERMWALVKDSKNQSILEAYIRQFGDALPFYGALARARLDELKREQAALAPPPPTPTKPQPATAVTPLRPSSRCDGVEAVVGGERRCLKAKDGFKDCDTCPEMVVVPAGDFMMGSPPGEEGRLNDEGPQHKVRIAKPFAVGKYEVTFAEWDACVSTGGCRYSPRDYYQSWGRGRRPVFHVSWEDIAGEFLPWLSRSTGQAYRLLSEAEWEYAARAGTTTPFSTGRTITSSQANFDGSQSYGGGARDRYRRQTLEVGSFAPNAFGLHDMHGNVAEFVEDCYRDDYAVVPADGSAVTSASCNRRVLRGGSWSNLPGDVRSASRSSLAAGNRQFNVFGFRVARDLGS
jgi:formylglycine-generating enzyme required for sulfatase activity